MPRLNTKGEYWSNLDKVEIIRDQVTTPGSTTVATANAADAVTIVLASSTNFTTGDLCRIGDREKQELTQIQGTVSTTMPLRFPILNIHAVGEVFKEQVATDIGHITDSGVKVTYSGDFNAVKPATRRLTTAYLAGNVEIMAEFECEGFSLENIATALAITEGRVLGSGTTAAPYTLATDSDEMYVSSAGGETDLNFRFTGARKDGAIVYVDLWSVELDFTALNYALTRGNPATLPMRARVTGGIRVSYF